MSSKSLFEVDTNGMSVADKCLNNLLVEEVMNATALCGRAEEEVEQALRQCASRIQRMPVLTLEGELQGISLPKERPAMPGKTDSEIEQWVLRELNLSEIRSREISVFSRDGVITLRGSAQTYEDKLAVEEATRRATGVGGVVNEMRLKPSTALIRRVPFVQVQSPGASVEPKAIQRPIAKTAAA